MEPQKQEKIHFIDYHDFDDQISKDRREAQKRNNEICKECLKVQDCDPECNKLDK